MKFINKDTDLEELIQDSELVFFGVDSTPTSKLIPLLKEVEELYPKYVKSCMAIPPAGISAIIKYQAHVTPTVLIIGKNKYNSKQIEVHARLLRSDISRDNLIGLVPEYADLMIV